VGPIDLGLLGAQRIEPQESLANAAGADELHVPPHRTSASPVASLDQHVVDAGGPQTWVPLERVLDEGDEGAEQRWRAILGTIVGLPLPDDAQHSADHVLMDTQLGGDGPDPPVLDAEQAGDLGLGLRRDRHRRAPSTSSAS